jgi:hypothetical protein
VEDFMKKSMVYLAVIVLSGVFAHTYGADKFFGVQFGPQWLEDTKKTAWDITAIGGLAVDQKAFFGGALDFIWSQSATEEQVGENAYRTDVDEKMFMVPISGYICINPVSNLIVNPTVSAQVGLNNMYYARKEEAQENDLDTDINGWYMGLFLRFPPMLIIRSANTPDLPVVCFTNIPDQKN